ncbi:MAG: DUF975 family protein [Urechidicola sp.]|nr:DUF975 family protein [Urechidicola sp.]
MDTSNSELMKDAERSLSGKWGLAVGTFFVIGLINFALQLMADYIPFSSIVNIIIAGPLALGVAIFSLNLSRDNNAKSDNIFDGFKNFGNAIGTYLLMVLFIFLWTLLLIIPGIIAALSYSMALFILADDPDIKPMEALDESKRMMDGHKEKLFFMYLRFFGWSLLCILTLGIGFLWFIPYANVSLAKFYDDLKKDQYNIDEIGEEIN